MCKRGNSKECSAIDVKSDQIPSLKVQVLFRGGTRNSIGAKAIDDYDKTVFYTMHGSCIHELTGNMTIYTRHAQAQARENRTWKGKFGQETSPGAEELSAFLN